MGVWVIAVSKVDVMIEAILVLRTTFYLIEPNWTTWVQPAPRCTVVGWLPLESFTGNLAPIQPCWWTNKTQLVGTAVVVLLWMEGNFPLRRPISSTISFRSDQSSKREILRRKTDTHHTQVSLRKGWKLNEIVQTTAVQKQPCLADDSAVQHY